MKKDSSSNRNVKFIKRGPQWVDSESGFSVWSAGRDKIEYVEGSHILSVYVDHDVEPYKLILFLSRADKWDPPYDSEKIDDTRLAKIHKNIIDALEFLETPIGVA